MSLSKSKRINHFLWSQLSAAKTLNSISGNFETGPAVVNAFKKAKSTARSPEDRKTLGFLKEYRERLANDHRVIRSSLFNEDEKMKISEHAQKAASPEVYSDFYYFLTREADANDIVEIGTNFGVSGQSFVKGLSDNQKENSFFLTFEGIPDLCEIAASRFEEILPKENFKVVEGNFDHTLKTIPSTNKKFDIIFIDGNHHYQPTVDYFNYLEGFAKENSIIILDDIYWSDEMIKAWKYLLDKTSYAYSVDFFKMGIIVKEKENNQQKKNHKLFLG